jgi:hypothetical protein
MSHQRPDFSKVGEGHYRLTLLAEGIQLDVKRLRWERGELLGLLSVYADFAGAKTVDGALSVGTFNLTSVSARGTRAKDLALRASAPEIDFGSLLEELCQRSIAAEEHGTPILLLRDVDPLPASDAANIVIEGFPVLRRHPTILFGDGGAGKSTLGLWLAGELQRRDLRTLYLDWECDQYDHRLLLERLFGADMPEVTYRRCERPLIIEADGIAEQVQECGIDYVICDSVAFACDGPPESAEVAQRYFRALRQLRVGSMNVAHVTKGEHGDQRPFGSNFWYFGCRACWYAQQADALPSDRRIHLGLYQRKHNLGARHPAIGFDIEFGDRITITGANVADIDQLAMKLPLSQRMFTALRRGPLTLVALAEETGGTVETLERYARKTPTVYQRITGQDGIARIALVERRTA